MPLLKAIIFSCLWVFGHGHLEQPEISVSRAMDQSAQISCKVSLQDLSKIDVHWYRQKPNQHLEYLIYVRTNYNKKSLEGKDKKIEVSKNLENSISTLKVNFLKKEDEAIYYCAFWSRNSSGWIKEFAGGTKLIVIPSDKIFDGDISPKPTIFLPSVAETNRHKAGTYLCLLEKFFPDVIKVNWKEKGSSKILQSLEGNPMKTNDTYMKVSWLTVPEESMDKEYRCIVKHEKNKRGVDQEILFPPANKVATTVNPTEAYLKTETAATTVDNNSRKTYLRHEHDVFQLQLTSTCAYYTYLLLLLKSITYFTIIAFCLFRRTSVCDDEKSS